MSNPFLTRQAKAGKSGHGKVSERRIAKSLRADLTPASGALRGGKGDMRRGRFLLEAKSTVNLTMHLDIGWLVKIETEALSIGRLPGVTVSFVGPDGKARSSGDWILVPKYVFDELTE